MREREREREREKIYSRSFLCVSFFSLCGSGCVFACSSTHIVEVVTCLVFQMKRQELAMNPKFASFLFSTTPPPPPLLVVCRGSHGNVEPIRGDTNGGGACGPVLHDLGGALARAHMEHGVGLQL